jgi:aryl-alcohol dehydrogenase-like predicted oxidoreductase
MDYGVANRRGMPAQKEITEIVSVAFQGGVRWFDTAQTYGEAEQRLGAALRDAGIAGEVHVVSKLGPAAGSLSRADLQHSLELTLDRLGVGSLGALLLHRSESLEGWGNGLGEFVRDALAAGTIEAFGISVYDPEEIRRHGSQPEVTAFQSPLNALDRRCADPTLYPPESKIFFRSVYLQGLLLLEPDEIQRKLPVAEGPVAQVRRFVADAGVRMKPFLLGLSLAAFDDSFLVLGVEDRQQMAENLALLHDAVNGPVSEAVREWVRQDRAFPESVINPTRWRTPA